MNNERCFFNWSCCELVKKKTGDKAVDTEANKFFKATMEYCKAVRGEIKAYLEAVADFYIGQGYHEDDMRVSSAMLNQFFGYDYVETGKKKQFTIFTDADFMQENQVGRALQQESRHPLEPDTKVTIVQPMTESMEQIFEGAYREPFPRQIKQYLTQLGIYDECLAVHTDDEDVDIDFMNVIMMAYLVLEERIGSAITMKNFLTDRGVVVFSESKSSANMGRLPEIEVDASVFTEAPKQKWYLNLSRICIDPITDYERAGLDRDAYQALAYQYLGSNADHLMRKLDSGMPFDFCAFVNVNDMCGEEILDLADGIRKCFLYNLDMAQRLEMDFEDIPNKYLPYMIMDGELENCNSMFAFSKDFRLVEIPLMPDCEDWKMVLTRYFSDKETA